MKEKLILQIMKECEADSESITREEAEEMAEMEIKAKGLKHYEQSEKPRKKPTRERKVDTDKLEILKRVKCLLADYGYEVELEKEVALHFGEYTLKLTRHRPQKK